MPGYWGAKDEWFDATHQVMLFDTEPAVLELHANPYFTNWLYYPRGVSLYFFASNPLHAFLSIPLDVALCGLRHRIALA